MRLGMMQPYFFPYLGYFSLIEQSDVFVLFDRAQFIRHGWVDRNRILKPRGDDWQYVRVPLRSSTRETAIADKQIDDRQPWRERLFAQLEHYRRRAPHYESVRSLLLDVLAPPHKTIASVDCAGIRGVCAYLGITTDIIPFSSLGVSVAADHGPGDWAFETCRALPDVHAYCNPIGGRELFDPSAFHAIGVALEFLEAELIPYPQLGSPFQAGLSIIDVMMFNSVAEIRAMLPRVRLRPT